MLAYAQIEPFGPLREDLRAGHIAAAVLNAARTGKSDPFFPKDFFPELDPARMALPAREGHSGGADAPILLDDPKKQADLIRLRLFGHAPGTMKPRKSKKHG